MAVVVLLGRILFSAIFVLSSFNHFQKPLVSVAAAQGVPMPELLVPLSGIIALLGGLSIIFGYKARLGALLLIVFLIPVTIMMHNFWAAPDPMAQQLINFMKNLSMLGGALIILYFGSGPYSITKE